MPETRNLYNPEFVTRLFDEMSRTYGLVNSISSFGFCYFWRVACAKMMRLREGDVVVDLMSGMSELSIVLNQRTNTSVQFRALDSSTEMCKLAEKSIVRKRLSNFQVILGDALAMEFDDDSVDAVGSTFGLKTFSHQQLQQLAIETFRILKPGGQIAFLEISVPGFSLLRLFYLFYLNYLIPIIGRLLMGNPENYRLLGVYTGKFQNCDRAIEVFRAAGFEVEPKSFFFGCATGFSGVKSVSK